MDEIKEFSARAILKATGNFVEERVVGCGDMGTVYRGKMGEGAKARTVAVKVLQHPKAARCWDAVQREAAALSRLRHENLVRLVGVCRGDAEGVRAHAAWQRGIHPGASGLPCAPCIVYEYLPGGNLHEFLEDLATAGPAKSSSYKRRLRMAHEIARGLHFMHSQDPPMVHRDLKPSNIMLDARGHAKIADLSLAGELSEARRGAEQAPESLSYVAPECKGEGGEAQGPAADVYALGLVLLQLFTAQADVRCVLEVVAPLHPRSREERQHELLPLMMGEDVSPAQRWPLRAALLALEVALQCTEERQQRPHLRRVLATLSELLGTEDASPPPRGSKPRKGTRAGSCRSPPECEGKGAGEEDTSDSNSSTSSEERGSSPEPLPHPRTLPRDLPHPRTLPRELPHPRARGLESCSAAETNTGSKSSEEATGAEPHGSRTRGRFRLSPESLQAPSARMAGVAGAPRAVSTMAKSRQSKAEVPRGSCQEEAPCRRLTRIDNIRIAEVKL